MVVIKDDISTIDGDVSSAFLRCCRRCILMATSVRCYLILDEIEGIQGKKKRDEHLKSLLNRMRDNKLYEYNTILITNY